MTRSELATWIVRMGEKYPRRVGMSYVFHSRTQNCIMGEIGIQSGICSGIAPCKCRQSFYSDYAASDWINDDGSMAWLANMAANLNNHGMEWGQIPKLLGLVPGEGPCEPALVTAGELIAPGVVCKDQPLAGSLVQPDTTTVPEEVAHAAV